MDGQDERHELPHDGWNPWEDEPPREAVERSLEWIREELRAQGKVLVVGGSPN